MNYNGFDVLVGGELSMDWKIVSMILIVLLLGVGLGYTVSFEVSQRDYSGQLDSIEGQLENVTAQLSELNQSLGILPQISNNTMHANEPSYSVLSQDQTAKWSSSSAGFNIYVFNCSGFSNMFVYLTVNSLDPPTGATWNFWLSKIDWHAYPSSTNTEFTYSSQDVAPGVLMLTTNPEDNFNGSTVASQGGASFATLGGSAWLYVTFNSTATGSAQITCTIYLRN